MSVTSEFMSLATIITLHAFIIHVNEAIVVTLLFKGERCNSMDSNP